MGEVQPADVVGDRLVGGIGHGKVELQEVEAGRPQQRIEERLAVAGGTQNPLEDLGRGEAAQVIGSHRFRPRAVPARQGAGIGAELGDQILPRSIDQGTHEVQQQGLGRLRPEAVDELTGLVDVNGGVAEVLIVGERRLRQGRLQVAEAEAGAQRPPQQGDGPGLVLLLDGGDQLRRRVGAAFRREGIGRLAQGIPGQMADHLQQRDQPFLIAPGQVIAQGEPVRRPGMGVGGAELETLGGPGNGAAQSVQGVAAGQLQAGNLPRHAVVFMPAEAAAEVFQGRRAALLGERVGDVQPDLAVNDFHGIAPQPVAAHQGLAALEIEFPVVPVAGEDAAPAIRPLGELALHQGIALVRAAVVASIDAGLAGEDGDLLAAGLEELTALFPQRLQRTDMNAVAARRRPAGR